MFLLPHLAYLCACGGLMQRRNACMRNCCFCCRLLLQQVLLIMFMFLNGRKISTHGKGNGCTPLLGSCMERSSRPERTSHKGSIKKRCTVRNCKVRLIRGKHNLEASAYTAGESGSTEHVVSLDTCDW